MIETRRLKNVIIFIQTILSFVLSRKIILRFILRDSTISLKMKEMQRITLKDDKSLIIKGANKGAAVIVWDDEDYLKETNKQLEDRQVYLEVPNNSSALVSTILTL